MQSPRALAAARGGRALLTEGKEARNTPGMQSGWQAATSLLRSCCPALSHPWGQQAHHERASIPSSWLYLPTGALNSALPSRRPPHLRRKVMYALARVEFPPSPEVPPPAASLRESKRSSAQEPASGVAKEQAVQAPQEVRCPMLEHCCETGRPRRARAAGRTAKEVKHAMR